MPARLDRFEFDRQQVVSVAASRPLRAIAMRAAGVLACALSVMAVSGCSSLLPRGSTGVSKPWESFDQARTTFDGVVLNTTKLNDLTAMGIDPGQTPNVLQLSHAEVLKRLMPPVSVPISALEPGVQACLAAQSGCRGLEVEQRVLKRERVSPFVLDFLNFQRTTQTTGWRFNALFVMVDDVVVYKLWTGQPKITEVESVRNPLGPFQGAGEARRR